MLGYEKCLHSYAYVRAELTALEAAMGMLLN